MEKRSIQKRSIQKRSVQKKPVQKKLSDNKIYFSRKIKQVTAWIAVLALVLLAVSVEPPVTYAQEKMYGLTLPAVEGCSYKVDPVHEQDGRESGERAFLWYQAGEKVHFVINSERELQAAVLKNDVGAEWQRYGAAAVEFAMPEQNLILSVELREETLEETAGTKEQAGAEKPVKSENDGKVNEDEIAGIPGEAAGDAGRTTENQGETAEAVGAGTEAGAETDTDTETDTDAEKDIEETDTDAGTDIEETEGITGTDAEAGIEADGETEAETGAETNADPETDAENVQEMLTEAETTTAENGGELMTEEESESETEREAVEAVSHRVFFEEDTRYGFVPMDARTEFYAGEAVEFTVVTEEELTETSIQIFSCGEPELAEMSVKEEDSMSMEQKALEASFQKETGSYSFIMPDADVVVLAEETEGIMLLDAEDEDPVPDQFKLICSQYPDYPHAPDNMQANTLKLAMTSRKKVVFLDSDGTKITKTAFCLQPALNGSGSGNTYEKDEAEILEANSTKNRNLIKALYYLYGGPAWGKSIDYKDGSGSVNLKELMNNGGKDCTTDDEYYCLAHYVLSYIYVGEKGEWNYMYTDEPVYPVLNSYGVAAVKKLAQAIAELPEPSTELSTSKVTAVYQQQQGMSVSQSITYKAVAENIAKLSLPAGVVLVNETTGARGTGTVSISGGDRFHLEAPSSVNGAKTYTVKTTYATDFTAMKLMQKDHQDVGFSYYSGDKTLEFEVDWPDQGSLKLRKADAETGSAVPYNDRYSLAGAVYGIYTDNGCTQKVSELKTGSDGTASQTLPLGTYYVKEITPPPGYQTDTTVYKAEVKNPAEEILVQLSDPPIKEKIQLQKVDRETGNSIPANLQASFKGAEYVICKDQNCTEVVERLVTDAEGKAESGDLRLGVYYVKETKTPVGYLPDETVYKVDLQQSDSIAVYQVSSKEQIIRGSLALMKYLDDNMEESILQDLYDSGKLENIRFQLVHEDPAVEPVIITTDRWGYAATGQNALTYGTWYLTEDPATTPDGYQGIKNVKIEITTNGIQKMYVVTNKPYEAYLCIKKLDRDTGALITRESAQFQILDSEGNAVKMPTFDGYTDTFATNGAGEIHLTQSLKAGDYSLVEIKAPDGYELAAPIPFRIEETAIFQEPLILECSDAPQKGRIKVNKLDKSTGEACGEGFAFQVIVKEDIVDGGGTVRREEIDGEELELTAGTVVDTLITDETGTAVSRELYLGSYLIREIQAGEYYAVSGTEYTADLGTGNVQNSEVGTAGSGENGNTENGNIEIGEEASGNVEMGNIETVKTGSAGNRTVEEETPERKIPEIQVEVFDERTKLTVQKTDAKEDAPMDGVEFSLWERDNREELRTGVTDETGCVAFENLRHDTVYCLQETKTRPGYVLDTTVYEIRVDENGWIEGEGVYEFHLTNEPNLVEISKQDITGGGELPGATLILEDEDGALVEEWVSGEEPHRIHGLTAGTYTLTEITAPKGYQVAEKITFTLTDSLMVQHVTMYDRPEEPEPETESEPEPETEPETRPETETETETEKITEKETEKQTEKIVVTTNNQSPKTGDFTPIAGMLFLAICSFILGVMELLRKFSE